MLIFVCIALIGLLFWSQIKISSLQDQVILRTLHMQERTRKTGDHWVLGRSLAKVSRNATIYVRLGFLESSGLIESKPVGSPLFDGGPQRRAYAITDRGSAVVEQAQSELAFQEPLSHDMVDSNRDAG